MKPDSIDNRSPTSHSVDRPHGSSARNRERVRRLWTVAGLTAFVLLTFAVYTLNAALTPSLDIYANSLLPFALLQHHNFFLESYVPQNLLHGLSLSQSYYLHPYRSHYISSYPVGAGFTAVPVYALFLLLGGHASFGAGLLLGKLSAALIATVSVMVVYHVLATLEIRPAYRILFTLLYAFGTETFAIGSQGMWEHGSAELWLSVFLLMAAKLYNRRRLQIWQSLLAGFAMGMLLLTRPQDMVIVLPFMVLLLSRSLPVILLCSTRFDELIPRLWHRLVLAFLYLTTASGWEIGSNITNAQWHVALLMFMVLIASHPSTSSWKVFAPYTELSTSSSGIVNMLGLFTAPAPA